MKLINLIILLSCITLSGCVVYRIPTPLGDATMKTFLKTVDIPKVTYSASNFTIAVEGYVSKGDTEMVTASAGAIGAMAGIAAGYMAQGNTNTVNNTAQ